MKYYRILCLTRSLETRNKLVDALKDADLRFREHRGKKERVYAFAVAQEHYDQAANIIRETLGG